MLTRKMIVGMVAVVLVLIDTAVWGKPVGNKRAEAVVKSWLKADPRPMGTILGREILRVETFTNESGEPVYYVVYLSPSGFVIVPADDLVEPIIAFSSGGTYNPSDDNCLGAAISRDVPGRIALARDIQPASTSQGKIKALTPAEIAVFKRGRIKAKNKWSGLEDYAKGVRTRRSLGAILAEGEGGSAGEGLETISDVRVPPLLESTWSQRTECVLACYNYYTPPFTTPGDPDNYPCGCVATAMAQLMRYHEHPVDGIGKHGFSINVGGAPDYAYTRGGDGNGGPYNWDQMVLNPDCGITVTQRQAIGALCYDAGVTVHMAYKKNGSRSSPGAADNQLTDYFMYSNSIYGFNLSGGNLLNRMINPNLDSSFPVILGIEGGTGAHAMVADGYGYNLTTLYHHINMGWGGGSDLWYNLPNVRDYYTINECIYNIFVSGTGEIISGRVVSDPGRPVSGVIVTAEREGGGQYQTQTNTNGIYALTNVPSDSSYVVSAAKEGFTFLEQQVTTETSIDFEFPLGNDCGNLWGVDFSWEVPTDVTPYGDFETHRVGLEGSFTPCCITYTLTNNGTVPINWEASNTELWLDIEPSSGTLYESEEINVNVSVNLSAYDLTVGCYFDPITIANLTDGYVHERSAIIKIYKEHFTEVFESDELDIENQTLTFYPDGSYDFYTICRQAAYEFPTDPSDGNTLTLHGGVEKYGEEEIVLSDQKQVSLYGESYESFYVLGNGIITFEAESWKRDALLGDISITSHFFLRSVSGYAAWLAPWDGGDISYKQLDDRIAVTFDDVPEWEEPNNLNSFQVELFFDGRIRVTHLNLALYCPSEGWPAIVGLSEGNGIPEDFIESDLSEYSSSHPGVHNIDKNIWYMSIQDAIDDANDGDVIEVCKDIYYENIDFKGKAITVRSIEPGDWDVVVETIIDGGEAGNVVKFSSVEDANSVLKGFTVRNGENGIYCDGTSPVISNCIIQDNDIRGIDCKGGSPEIKNNWIHGNSYGIGLAFGSNPVITNNTIVSNSNYGINTGSGGATPTISNCILWGHNGNDLSSGASATYSCFEDCNDANGVGNICYDPMFVDDANDNYHLDVNSPCVDTGDPAGYYDWQMDIDGHPRVMVEGVDMGADETAYFPTCHPDYNEWVNVDNPICWCYQRQCYGDTDGLLGGGPKTGFYAVGPLDFNILIAAWLVEEPPHGPGIDSISNGICADFDHDLGGSAKTGYYRVGTSDLNILLEYWMIKEPPDGNGVDPNCLECE
jgi:parallel beta-helix repeat protein